MRLSPRDRRRIRRALRDNSPDPSEQVGELNIVPFLDIVVNVMLFLLATTAAAMAVAQTEAELPGTCAPGCVGSEVPPLGLSVTVLESAIVVATAPAHLEFGRRIEGQDFAVLAEHLESVHRSFPDEREVILSAAPGVSYQLLIRAMDAARGPTGERFERVRLSAGVR